MDPTFQRAAVQLPRRLRARREITASGRLLVRRDGIVPLAMEIVTRDVDRLHLSFSDLEALARQAYGVAWASKQSIGRRVSCLLEEGLREPPKLAPCYPAIRAYNGLTQPIETLHYELGQCGAPRVGARHRCRSSASYLRDCCGGPQKRTTRRAVVWMRFSRVTLMERTHSRFAAAVDCLGGRSRPAERAPPQQIGWRDKRNFALIRIG
jgi:hypothetical protein